MKALLQHVLERSSAKRHMRGETFCSYYAYCCFEVIFLKAWDVSARLICCGWTLNFQLNHHNLLVGVLAAGHANVARHLISLSGWKRSKWLTD